MSDPTEAKIFSCCTRCNYIETERFRIQETTDGEAVIATISHRNPWPDARAIKIQPGEAGPLRDVLNAYIEMLEDGR